MNYQKGFWSKPLHYSKQRINSFCPDSPKEWFCECENTLHKEYKIFDDTKEGNKKYTIR
jgi:hypothetical protein